MDEQEAAEAEPGKKLKIKFTLGYDCASAEMETLSVASV